MAINAALTLLALTSTPETELIGDLNSCFNFDHNIILAMKSKTGPSIDINSFVRNENQPKSLFLFESANFRGLKSLGQVDSKNPFMIVVPESSSFNTNLLKQIARIQKYYPNMKTGIFFKSITSMDDIKAHFLWFRDQLITNTFAAVHSQKSQSLNIFTFHSFGKFEVINATTRETCEQIFPNLDSNYHQHRFRVGELGNVAYKRFWMSALHLMNATYTPENIDNNVAMDEHLRNGFDILLVLGSFSQKSRLFPMYPLLLDHENIIVPEAEPYSGIYAYFQALTSDEIFAYCAGTIVAIVVTLSVCRYVKQDKFPIFRSLSDCLNLLINDNDCIKYQRLSRAETFLIVPLTFVGFIVVNGYLSNLQSHMTKPALQPQLKALSDIYRSPLSVAAIPGYVKVVREKMKYQSTLDWKNKIVAIDAQSYQSQITNFDTSAAYLLDGNGFKMLSKVQRRLNIRGFYDTGITVSNSLLVFVISESVMFFDKLNEIVHLTHSSGLLQQWLEEHNSDMEKIIFDMNRSRLNLDQRAANEIDFPMFLVYGWIASTIVLIIEIVWDKLGERIVKKFR